MSPRPTLAPPVLSTLGTSRRTAVVGAVASLGVLAGCDIGDTDGDTHGDTDGPGTSPDASGATTLDEDADAALVDEVRAELDELVALVTGLHSRRSGLRDRVTGLLETHVAHRAALVEPGLPTPTPSAPAGGAEELWGFLVQRERTAQRRLEDWAVAAQSGTLARLLASMAAGVAAHLAAVA